MSGSVALRGLLALFLVTVLVAGAGLSLAQQMRLERIAASAALVQARQEAANLRLRIAEMDAGLGQAAPQLPAITAVDELDAELQLQESLLDLARAQDVVPMSFGGAPVPVQTGQPAVGFSFEFETGHDRAMGFVEALERLEPALAVHGVWIRQLPVGALGDEETPVTVRLTLWSFWTPLAGGQGG